LFGSQVALHFTLRRSVRRMRKDSSIVNHGTIHPKLKPNPEHILFRHKYIRFRAIACCWWWMFCFSNPFSDWSNTHTNTIYTQTEYPNHVVAYSNTIKNITTTYTRQGANIYVTVLCILCTTDIYTSVSFLFRSGEHQPHINHGF